MKSYLLLTLFASGVPWLGDARAQEPSLPQRAFSVQADIGPYFFRSLSPFYQTTSKAYPSLMFSIGLSPSFDLSLRGTYLWLREVGSATEYLPNPFRSYTYPVSSNYDEFLGVVDIEYRLPISTAVEVDIGGGPAVAYVEEAVFLAGPINYITAFGFSLGAQLEVTPEPIPVSLILRIEANYEPRPSRGLSTSYGGELVSVGLRYSISTE